MSKTTHTLALCTDLSHFGSEVALDSPPGWVELIPAGPNVTGRDGRTWLFDGLGSSALIGDSSARNASLPIDWEHATQHRAPNGEEAPAAAWIGSLDLRDGALWGQVEWTARGGGQVTSKAYRYLHLFSTSSPQRAASFA